MLGVGERYRKGFGDRDGKEGRGIRLIFCCVGFGFGYC